MTVTTTTGSKESKQNQPNHSQQQLRFPWKLHILLERQSNQNVISWMPDGKSFLIHDKEKFAKHIMPEMFGTTNFKTFQRNLNLWGFTRISKGPHKDETSHPLFLRGYPSLCQNMKRITLKGTGRGNRAPRGGLSEQDMLKQKKHTATAMLQLSASSSSSSKGESSNKNNSNAMSTSMSTTSSSSSSTDASPVAVEPRTLSVDERIVAALAQLPSSSSSAPTIQRSKKVSFHTTGMMMPNNNDRAASSATAPATDGRSGMGTNNATYGNSSPASAAPTSNSVMNHLASLIQKLSHENDVKTMKLSPAMMTAASSSSSSFLPSSLFNAGGAAATLSEFSSPPMTSLSSSSFQVKQDPQPSLLDLIASSPVTRNSALPSSAPSAAWIQLVLQQQRQKQQQQAILQQQYLQQHIQQQQQQRNQTTTSLLLNQLLQLQQR